MLCILHCMCCFQLYRFSLPRLSPTIPHAMMKLMCCMLLYRTHSGVPYHTLHHETSMRGGAVSCQHLTRNLVSQNATTLLPMWNPYKPYQLCHSLKPRNYGECKRQKSHTLWCDVLTGHTLHTCTHKYCQYAPQTTRRHTRVCVCFTATADPTCDACHSNRGMLQHSAYRYVTGGVLHAHMRLFHTCFRRQTTLYWYSISLFTHTTHTHFPASYASCSMIIQCTHCKSRLSHASCIVYFACLWIISVSNHAFACVLNPSKLLLQLNMPKLRVNGDLWVWIPSLRIYEQASCFCLRIETLTSGSQRQQINATL